MKAQDIYFAIEALDRPAACETQKCRNAARHHLIIERHRNGKAHSHEKVRDSRLCEGCLMGSASIALQEHVNGVVANGALVGVQA